MTEQQDYHKQQKENENKFFDLLKQFSPDIYVLIKMIKNENLSISVFWKLARHLINISNGTGYGDIHIIIENNNIVFINGLEKDRVSEPIRKETNA